MVVTRAGRLREWSQGERASTVLAGSIVYVRLTLRLAVPDMYNSTNK